MGASARHVPLWPRVAPKMVEIKSAPSTHIPPPVESTKATATTATTAATVTSGTTAPAAATATNPSTQKSLAQPPVSLLAPKQQAMPNALPAPTTTTSDTTPVWYQFNQQKKVSCNGFDHRKIMIGVISSPSHIVARDVIRNTWAKDAQAMGIEVKFFVGLTPPDKSDLEAKLAKESNLVRFDDFIENYHNLTAKAIDVFSYARDRCVAGLLKVDDDTLVRVPKLMSFLAQFELENLYSGNIIRSAPVIKNPQGRWYAYDQYPYDHWPTYANGPGFFLGRQALDRIADNRATINRIRIDDSAVGVWTQEMNLNIVEMPASFFQYSPQNDVVVQNPLEADEMLRAYKGEVFTPRACEVHRPFSCRCGGNPQSSNDQIPACWEAMGNSPYSDSTLRA
eukprot:c6933_g1_i1.p1 GENE.c6933_g1_i1~~c6933_g1_i1.p1  ORF type:complete len:445 (+),score=124.54 c6933_g1_i1:151-1335(+)